MKQSMGGNLVTVAGSHGDRSVQCAKCGTALGPDWRHAARSRTLPATAAGPLMAIMEGEYDLAQLVCPSCGALFDTELVEKERH